MKGLEKKEREDIFKLFLTNDKFRFNEIEKRLKLRSNLVSYHLERMQKEGLLEKRDDYYFLTKEAEKYIPTFQKKLNPLPIVLVALMNEDKILLMKRNKRPYKNYWGLIGGKMLLEESFTGASKRLVREKSLIEIDNVTVNSVLHERVLGDEIIKHSFILFFTKANTDNINFKKTESGELRWFSLQDLENESIIPSDLYLIKNKLNSSIDCESALMYEKDGELLAFRFLDEKVNIKKLIILSPSRTIPSFNTLA